MKLKSLTIKVLSLCFLINSCSTDEELENTNTIDNLQNLKTNNLNHKKNPPVLYDDLPTKEEDERLGKFVLQGNKWNTNNLTYYYKNGTPDIINNDERNGIREAFNLWTEVTPLTFTEIQNPNADIIIAFEEGDHGDGSNFDGTGGVLAHAFFPPPNGGSLAGDMHFDESEAWTISLRPSSLSPRDIITVAAHEIGHSLGLRHSDIAGALMFPFYNGSHRFLDNDDVEGIQSIYGTPNTPFTSNSGWNNTSRVRTLADVNGDGKADIVGFGDSSVYVSLSNGNGFNSATSWTNSFTSNSGWNNTSRVRTLADVNGDGKADIVGFGDSSVYVSLSNGNGFNSA
ncbi:matrixin family metalloprotease, partial [Tenacibaculum soleae]|uniref:matrixin family metalloprotease n=1 Tax=Tenacibaculum soleae TaxID=447689 RepID=UPI0026E48476